MGVYPPITLHWVQKKLGGPSIKILVNVGFDVQTDRLYTMYTPSIALTILIYLHQQNSCYTAWLVLLFGNGSILEID